MTPEELDEWEPENRCAMGSGGPLQPDHVICPNCAHNFSAVSEASMVAIRSARAEAFEEAARIAAGMNVVTVGQSATTLPPLMRLPTGSEIAAAIREKAKQP